MQNKRHDDLISPSKFTSFSQKIASLFSFGVQKENLYETQDTFRAIVDINVDVVRKHIALKKWIVWLLLIIFMINIYSLHLFIQEIIKPQFITTQNQSVLKYILMTYMAFALGISSALIALAGKWPQLIPAQENKKPITSLTPANSAAPTPE